MSVQSQINRIIDEVSDQTAIIQQIKTALENKAAGGSDVKVSLENGVLSIK